MGKAKLVLLTATVVSVVGGAVFGLAMPAFGTASTPTPLAAFSNPALPHPADASAAADLAAAVTRWNSDAANSSVSAGVPLIGEARDLATGLGKADDTITAFPTSNGLVCYEIRAAGSCGRVDDEVGPGFVVSVLYTRDEGTRVFGVVSDAVRSVDVEVAHVTYPATLRGNAFYYDLPSGVSGSSVDSVSATWSDGTVHSLEVHA